LFLEALTEFGKSQPIVEDADVPQEGRTGQCGLCLQEATLARLVPLAEGGVFGTGAGFVSMQRGSPWCSYNEEQAYVSPVCTTCAAGLWAGTMTAARKYLYNAGAYSVWLMWWPDRPTTAPPPWEALYALLDEGTAPVCASGHLAAFSLTKGRLGLRRHAYVDGAQLATRLQRWKDIVGVKLPVAAGAIDKNAYAPLTEQLWLTVLGGEEPEFGTVRKLRKLAVEDGWTAQLCGKILTYLNEAPPEATLQLDPSTTLTPRERAAWYYGRAFAVVERLQRQKSGPQRLVSETHLRAAKHSPHTVVQLAERYGSTQHGGLTRKIEDLITNAELALDAPAGTGLRFSTHEAHIFLSGMRAQKHADREEAKARAEAEKTKNTDTIDNK
jgi:hypothetical protein